MNNNKNGAGFDPRIEDVYPPSEDECEDCGVELIKTITEDEDIIYKCPRCGNVS